MAEIPRLVVGRTHAGETDARESKEARGTEWRFPIRTGQTRDRQSKLGAWRSWERVEGKGEEERGMEKMYSSVKAIKRKRIG